MTEYAEKLILAKLEKWQKENGANPVDVLNESIERGWSGVFLNGHGNAGAKFGANGSRPVPLGTTRECAKCGSAQWVKLDRYGICERCVGD